MSFFKTFSLASGMTTIYAPSWGSKKNRFLILVLSVLLVSCGGGGGGSQPRFESATVGSTPAVRDNHTGIVWAASLGTEDLPSQSSLPTAAELWQLTDLGGAALRANFGFVLDASNPLIQVADRVNTTDGRVWSVDFGLDLEIGGISDQATGDVNTWHVLSRTRATAANSYSDLKDGSVFDGNLVWKMCSEGSSWSANESTCVGTPSLLNAKDAQLVANQLNLTGFANARNWQLPTQQQLRSLLQLENQLTVTGLMPSAFAKDTPVAKPLYWTSGRTLDGQSAWQVDFSGGIDPGGVTLAPLTDLAYVRLVRVLP
jgi:hypothetical protein